MKDLIKHYLSQTRMLQLATSVNDQPWNVTVYFAYDEELNLYWISKSDTRHSQEIAQNPKVAGILVYDQQPTGKSLKGLSFEGIAEELSGEDEEKASKLYIEQLQREETLLEDIRSGKNQHKIYRITPTKFIVIDSTTSPVRQEYIV